MATVRTLAEAGVVRAGEGTAGGAARGVRQAGRAAGRVRGGRPAEGGGRGTGVRDEQPGADGVPEVPVLGPAHQQRGGRERDDTDDPENEGDGEVLAAGGSEGHLADQGSAPQRGR